MTAEFRSCCCMGFKDGLQGESDEKGQQHPEMDTNLRKAAERDEEFFQTHSDALDGSTFPDSYNSKQDIFAYLGEINTPVKRIHDMNKVLPKEAAIEIP